jgi:hypothetical protein
MRTMPFSSTVEAVSSEASVATLAVAPVTTVPQAETPAAETGPRTTLTVITPIKPDRLQALKESLEAIEARCPATCPLPGMEDSIHTMRWVILPNAIRESGVEVGYSLVLWIVFDGSLDQYLDRLPRDARRRLDTIYGHCEGYPIRPRAADVKKYLVQHQARGASACFDGVIGRTRKQIIKEDELRTKLKAFLDAGDWTGCSQSHIYLAAKAWLRQTQPSLHWALEPPPRPETPSLRVYAWVGAAVAITTLLAYHEAAVLAAAIGLGVVLLALTVVLLVLTFALYRDELRAARDFVPPPRDWFTKHDRLLRDLDKEKAGFNRITILTDVHPAWVRWIAIRVVLWIVNLVAAWTTGGKLQDVETIHFAQWRLVDDGKRLLFMSNYDGRADDYFRDFADNAAPGVNAIWSNTVGFPPTTLLIGRGSRDLPIYQQAARAYQIPTDVWYLGYPSRAFTTKRINDNTRIRRGLAGHLTPPEVKEWLEMIYADPD